MASEAEKFMAWYKQEKEGGLVDVKFFVGEVSQATSESFFREANEMNESDSVSRYEYKDTVERLPVAKALAVR